MRVPQARDGAQGGSTRGHVQEAEKAGVCARVQETACGGEGEMSRPEESALCPYFFFSKIVVKYTYMKCTTVTISKCTVEGIKSIVGHVPSSHMWGWRAAVGTLVLTLGSRRDPLRSLPGALGEGMKKLILPSFSTDKVRNMGKQGVDTLQKQMGTEFYFFP